MPNLLRLLRLIDIRFNSIERDLKALERDISKFEQQLKPLPASEQLQYLELSRSIENRLANIRRLLEV